VSASGGSVADQGDEILDPVLTLQEEVEVEQVVRHQGRTAVFLVQLGGEPPDLFADPDRHQERADRRARVVHDGGLATRAAEAIGPTVVVDADADRDVRDPQAHRATTRALSLDRCHDGPSAGPRGPLRPVSPLTRPVGAVSHPLYDAPAVTPITFAHRGARAHHPENTIPAFRHALERGAAGLETDAWLSGDGEVVLVHDNRVWSRQLGVVPRRVTVEKTPAATLSDLGIPRLNDLYESLGADFELSVDLKSRGVSGRLLEVARAAGDIGRTWLCAPSFRRLTELRDSAPDVHLVHSQARSRLPRSLERHAADLANAGVDAMNLHHSEWTAGLVALFHRFGVRAFAWDAQEERHLRAMLAIEIDAVYCDHVDRMVRIVEDATGGGAVPERPEGV
jgi:glycerophosphoryl diester phosphodiesterase